MAGRLNLVVVGVEKELDDFVEAVEACKKTVGPIKVFSAFRSIDAASKISTCAQTCGAVHGVLLQHTFSAKGKEEYSEVIRKSLKEKHPEVPIVCWGVVKKGGEFGKEYHYGLDWSPKDGPAPVAKVLMMLKHGEIKADYKKRKSVDETRKSLDKIASPVRRKSVEGAPPGSPSRRSLDGVKAGDKKSVTRKSVDMPEAKPSPLSRKSIEGSSRTGSMDMKGGTMSPKGILGIPDSGISDKSLAGGPYSGMASMMGGLKPMLPMTGMTSMTGSGMTPMLPMYGMQPMTGMVMQPMTSMGMQPMASMVMQPMSGMVMQPMTSMGMPPMTGAVTPGLGVGLVTAMPPAPAALPAVQPPAPSADAGGSNAELIKALADEVMRLTVLVEEKRAREAAQASAGSQVQATQIGTTPMGSGAGGLSMGVMGMDPSGIMGRGSGYTV